MTLEDLEEMMQDRNTNDVENLLEDEKSSESDDAEETEQRKVMIRKVSLL